MKKTTGDKQTDNLLTPEGMKLWHAEENASLITTIKRDQWRLLAQYFNDIALMQELLEEGERIKKTGKNPYRVALPNMENMEGPSQWSKDKAKTEKDLRNAETRLGLISKDLGKQPKVKSDSGHNFGG